MTKPREIQFLGRSREDAKSFPAAVRQRLGRELFRIQLGLDPSDWKPMGSIGPGVKEIRIRDQSGAFRVIYIAKLKDAIYVVHCFEKKSQKTSRADIERATARYRSLLRSRGN